MQCDHCGTRGGVQLDCYGEARCIMCSRSPVDPSRRPTAEDRREAKRDSGKAGPQADAQKYHANREAELLGLVPMNAPLSRRYPVP